MSIDKTSHSNLILKLLIITSCYLRGWTLLHNHFMCDEFSNCKSDFLNSLQFF